VSEINELREVIRKVHGSRAVHLKSVPVKEVYHGKTVWDVVVQVFLLRDHPQTNKVYAWSYATDDLEHPKRHVTVLHIPPAITPENAVKVALLQEFRDGQPS
jgi:hypothetical protein